MIKSCCFVLVSCLSKYQIQYRFACIVACSCNESCKICLFLTIVKFLTKKNSKNYHKTKNVPLSVTFSMVPVSTKSKKQKQNKKKEQYVAILLPAAQPSARGGQQEAQEGPAAAAATAAAAPGRQSLPRCVQQLQQHRFQPPHPRAVAPLREDADEPVRQSGRDRTADPKVTFEFFLVVVVFRQNIFKNFLKKNLKFKNQGQKISLSVQ